MDMLPKPKREPEPLVVENVEESKEETKEEVKEEVKEKFVGGENLCSRTPEEELNQYSSEDDEAFAERVRMRMLANERKKAMRKKLEELRNKLSLQIASNCPSWLRHLPQAAAVEVLLPCYQATAVPSLVHIVHQVYRTRIVVEGVAKRTTIHHARNYRRVSRLQS